MTKHTYQDVPGFEGLAWCTVCHCAEGTLPTACPGVRVPGRVQTLIIRGVVDFVDGRWVGLRKPLRVTIRLGASVEEMAQSLHSMGKAFAAAGLAMADSLPRTSRDVAFGRLMLITGRDRVLCNDPRIIRYALV